ncbi:pseudouridylate synthase RPUSD2-like isoform X1 [Macrosteles quadrilineatus]|uniref:pseudouridylate synthase RPUSD2-like isoform X1 n=1 Tax=Macrosteles quadrilineatus TaxID=74068 RepID=UPI0023E26382|nr:pseudouridylate synthase RPUSD2-like isoform X1 [Macrosteles quadrilineatus]
MTLLINRVLLRFTSFGVSSLIRFTNTICSIERVPLLKRHLTTFVSHNYNKMSSSNLSEEPKDVSYTVTKASTCDTGGNIERSKEENANLEEDTAKVVENNAIEETTAEVLPQMGKSECSEAAEFGGNLTSVGTQCSGSNEVSIVVWKTCWSENEEEPEPNDTVDQKLDDNLKDKEGLVTPGTEKRKASDDLELNKDLKKAKLETKALKAKRPGFTDDRYNETSYYIENGLRKVYPYYFTFTTFTKGRWVGEKILDVFAREFRAHPAEEYERCIKTGSLTVNYEKVDIDYRLKHNDLLANIVHRHEVPVTADPIAIVHMDEDVVVVNKPASIPVHPCGRYRHNTVVFILAKEYHLKNLRTIHRLDRLTSGLLLFGRTPKKARQMEHQIRNRQVQKEYICRVEGEFPDEVIECVEPIEVVSYKIGVCKVSPKGKDCNTTFQKLGYNPETNTSVVLCLPHTGRMHQIRVHLQYLGYPVVNDPLYNHTVFGPEKGRGGNIGKSDEELIRDLISIHNAENWLGMDGDSELSMFKPTLLNFDEEDKGGLSREGSPSLPPPPPPHPPPLVAAASAKVTVATQTGQDAPDLSFHPDKLTSDPHCYECKVKYRDPKPRDLVMYLHAWKYRGPGWSYQTELPEWARIDWVDTED